MLYTISISQQRELEYKFARAYLIPTKPFLHFCNSSSTPSSSLFNIFCGPVDNCQICECFSKCHYKAYISSNGGTRSLLSSSALFIILQIIYIVHAEVIRITCTEHLWGIAKFHIDLYKHTTVLLSVYKKILFKCACSTVCDSLCFFL